MTSPYQAPPPPTPEERALRAERLAGGAPVAPGLEPTPGGFWRGRTAGIPNWGWVIGGVVVGGVLLWYFARRRAASAAADSSQFDSGTFTEPSGSGPNGTAVLDNTTAGENILAILRDLQGRPSVPLTNPDSPDWDRYRRWRRNHNNDNDTPDTSPDTTTPPPTTTTPPPVPTPTTPTTPAPATPIRHYIHSGDTLSAIAAGWGVSTTALYNKNAALIEQSAHQHGLSSSRGGPSNSLGWWIFPGVYLVHP